MANILLLDNIDSFTYNLVDQLRSTEHNVILCRNTLPVATILAQSKELDAPLLMLSPGFGLPKHAGCMMQLLAQLSEQLPIIGIGLGHLALIEHYGGKIQQAKQILHGKVSLITHDQQAMFQVLPTPLPVACYHSLIATHSGDKLIVTAHLDGEIMAVRHISKPICGFQFHPESILTPHGAKLLEQTISWTQAKAQQGGN